MLKPQSFKCVNSNHVNEKVFVAKIQNRDLDLYEYNCTTKTFL